MSSLIDTIAEYFELCYILDMSISGTGARVYCEQVLHTDLSSAAPFFEREVRDFLDSFEPHEIVSD